jgi:UDP-2,3-diacylglucosamine pyrophosphatase LpxH
VLAFIGDLHLCAGKLPREDYVKSLDKFLGIIKNHKEKCHGIMVIGDLFDHKLSVDELEFASAMIVNLASNGCGRDHRLHVPVYFIHGTYTHDYDQYNIFLPLLEKIDNVKVYYTDKVCDGVLENGTKVLFVPQEYGNVDYSE